MNPVHHHCFTLWVRSNERQDEKVPVCDFYEGKSSSDDILMKLLALDELGLCCFLTCRTWSSDDLYL